MIRFFRARKSGIPPLAESLLERNPRAIFTSIPKQAAMRITGLLLSVLLLGVLGAHAQYDTLWIGTAGGPSTSLANTPFPTASYRAARTQYLVHSQQLVDAGLLPGHDIHGICLQLVDNDASNDPNCLVDLHVAMKNETTWSLVDLVYSGLAPSADTTDVHLEQGILGLHFHETWQWTGPGSNMVVELTLERGEVPGLDPRILLDTGLAYTSTFTIRTDQPVQGSSLSSLTSGAETDSDNSLPILGLLVNNSTSITTTSGMEVIELAPVPASNALRLTSAIQVRDLCVLDLNGRVALHPRFSGTLGTIDVSTLAAGSYVLRTIGTDGSKACVRFVKE